MTNANMKFVVVEVLFPDKMELSDPKLEEGEHIVKRIVELPKLSDELAGELFSEPFCLWLCLILWFRVRKKGMNEVLV